MRPKSEIYTPKRDDEHPYPLQMRSPPPGLRSNEKTRSRGQVSVGTGRCQASRGGGGRRSKQKRVAKILPPPYWKNEKTVFLQGTKLRSELTGSLKRGKPGREERMAPFPPSHSTARLASLPVFTSLRSHWSLDYVQPHPPPDEEKTERGSSFSPLFLCRREGAATRRLVVPVSLNL